VSKLSEITTIVFDCIDQLNRQLPVAGKLGKSPDSVLVGDTGVLDSLSIITLCTNIEQELQERLNIHVPLLDELMTEKVEHPIRVVGTMLAWIEQQSNEVS
jgi:acyl carrier protein